MKQPIVPFVSFDSSCYVFSIEVSLFFLVKKESGKYVFIRGEPMQNASGSIWRIGEILIRRGVITWTQLESALDMHVATGRKTGQILLDRGLIHEKDLFQGLAYQIGMSYADLKRVTPQPEALRLFPKRLAYQYSVLPLVYQDDVLLVAISEVLDPFSEEEIQEYAKTVEIRFVLCCPEDLSRAIKYYYGPEGIAA